MAYRNSLNVNDRSERIVQYAGTVINATHVNENWIKDSANGLYLPIAIDNEVLMQQVVLPGASATPATSAAAAVKGEEEETHDMKTSKTTADEAPEQLLKSGDNFCSKCGTARPIGAPSNFCAGCGTAF